ncbi:MAG: hypothetical protein J0L56_08010 [Chitinophagales bacterium]|nr:hypothetical protein [Chitinophagales bacterium]
MKKVLLILLLSFLLVSCKKEKEFSIIGSWQLESIYRRDQSGEFRWFQVSNNLRLAFFLNFTGDGRYSSSSDIPEDYGTYFYNHSANILTFSSSRGMTYEVKLTSVDNNRFSYNIFVNGELYSTKKYIRRR